MENIIEFNSNDYMNIEGSTEVDTSEYAFIINDMMKYITDVKKNNEGDISLLDIIMEYSFKNNISIEALGDAIYEDEYFKSFIKKDCELYNIIRTENPKQEDW